jgi:hypothetical protein
MSDSCCSGSSTMPGLGIDLNEAPPESALNHPIDWDEIGDWDGPAHELDYAMVWDDGNQGADLIMIPDLSFVSSVCHLIFLCVSCHM